ncbi:MAG: YkgJ family cysteine cluster protein [Myxococcales bacterium]|nr:YkgJ family cysteine cluster protein [Myxococcales bacterium]
MSEGDAAPRRALREHLRLIDQGVAPVVERHPDQVRCGPGCSDCCHQTFRVSALEGAYLREGLAVLPAPERAEILARAARHRPDRRQPCPVLGDDGRCRLYEHRPRICRKYGIPLWHPDRPHEVRCCPLNFRSMADIDPELILEPQAAWAEDWIRLREALGIRDPGHATIAEHLLAGDEEA